MGAWCGVKTALRDLDLGGPSLPFDWIRSSLDSLLHSLRNDFDGFLAWETVQDSPYKEHATPHGRIYTTLRHSFWHDDLEDHEERVKFFRRIERFNQLGALGGPLLFVRSLNSTLELRRAEELLASLEAKFGKGQVWLLLLVDAQPEARFWRLARGPATLLVHAVESAAGAEGQRYASRYRKCILAAIEYVQVGMLPVGYTVVGSLCDLVKSQEKLIRHVCLGEDLAVPWCHDPVMPPSVLLKCAAGHSLDQDIVSAQIDEHYAFRAIDGQHGVHYPT